MPYQTERFHLTAAIQGLGVVWEEDVSAQDLDSMVAALRNPDPNLNVLAENRYDLLALMITIRALPLSDFDKMCQDDIRERAEAEALRPRKFTVTHAQRRFDGPDDAPKVTTVTVHSPSLYDTARAGTVYLTSGPHGCSRDLRAPSPESAIRNWLSGDHAQTVLSVVPVTDQDDA